MPVVGATGPAAAENRLVTERESVTGFVKFLD